MHVVYVHGLWMPGDESLMLRRRLAQQGMTLHPFRYSAVHSVMSDVTASLHAFVRGLPGDTVHFIGHSLGGLVIHRLLERYPQQPAGNTVFLGTPSVSSRAAVGAARFVALAQLMGQSVAEELLQPRERRWTYPRPLGIIAGTHPIGIGQFLAHFGEDNDGTVAVSETRMPGATDHIALPVSHFGLLTSARVARETALFLKEGHFSLR
ncbi:MAG: alpha/beta hydrolase [Proteobacteria bacterium]|nr:alpha/beta hydrolase [Pseudomonadota bacterium]